MGRPRKYPLDPVVAEENVAFSSRTLGGVYVEGKCVYFVGGVLTTSDATVIDALRKMAHLGVLEERAGSAAADDAAA